MFKGLIEWDFILDGNSQGPYSQKLREDKNIRMFPYPWTRPPDVRSAFTVEMFNSSGLESFALLIGGQCWNLLRTFFTPNLQCHLWHRESGLFNDPAPNTEFRGLILTNWNVVFIYELITRQTVVWWGRKAWPADLAAGKRRLCGPHSHSACSDGNFRCPYQNCNARRPASHFTD
jgi:hypothetical protein